MTHEAIVDLYHEWQCNPVSFVLDCLRVPKISSQQEEALIILGKLSQGKISQEQFYASKHGISIMAGKGVGKDAMSSWIVLWFLTCFRNAEVVIVGPDLHHIQNVLLKEIKLWHSRRTPEGEYAFLLRDYFKIDDKGVKYIGPGKTTANWGAYIKSSASNIQKTRRSNAFQGIHAENLMVVCDEAASLPDEMFDSLEETLTLPHNFCLAIFNPINNTSYPVRTQTDPLTQQRWIIRHWSAEDSELVDKEHIKSIFEKYGSDREANGFRINVRGLPPRDGESTLIPWSWVNSAVGRTYHLLPEQLPHAPVAGLDVARYGDDKSALVIRQGPYIYHISQWGQMDSIQTAEEAIKRILELPENHRPRHLYIDSIGVGAGVFDQARRKAPAWLTVHGVDVGVRSSNQEKWTRLRDELWWKCRQRFEEKRMVLDPAIIAQWLEQLTIELSGIQYEVLQSGIVKVEDKKSLKSRFGKNASPNIADALCLTFKCNDYNEDGIPKAAAPVRQIGRPPDYNKDFNGYLEWMAI